MKHNKKQINVVAKTPSNLSYEGTIKVSIRKKDTVLSTKTFKNNGRWPLFQFLTTCLAGSYNDAENLRPYFINLYQYGNIGDFVPLVEDDIAFSNFTKDKVNLISYSYSGAPELSSDQNMGIGNAKIKYKFIIPFTHIDTNKNITLVCLNNRANFDQNGNPSVFFFVTDENGKLKSLVESEAYSGKTTEYNLYIEWFLEIKNEVKGE